MSTHRSRVGELMNYKQFINESTHRSSWFVEGMRPCKFSIPYFPDQILVKTKQIKKLKTSLIDRTIVVVTVINMVIIRIMDCQYH